VDAISLSGRHATPFQAATAFSPWCVPPRRPLNAPLWILIGEADEWTPAARGRERLRQSAQLGEQTADRLTLRGYPGAPHACDRLTPPSPSSGHTVGRHPEAAGQAEAQGKQFLGQHLALQPYDP
jgi:dienelactone hydrolase